MLIERFTLVVLPARSVAIPVTTCAAPSFVKVTGLLEVAIPERPSEVLKLTVTLVLFHPLALGAGVATAAMSGGVLSILTPLTVADAELPARSETVKV